MKKDFAGITKRLVAGMLVAVAVVGVSALAIHPPSQNSAARSLNNIQTDKATLFYAYMSPSANWFMYFVMIRPQKKRQEQQQKLIGGLKTGDRVVTNAGIHGLISNVKETTVLVKVADNVKIEMDKSAITNVLKEA